VGASVGDQVVDERILDLFAGGHTIVLQALHRFWPPLISFAGRLSAELGHPAQVNAYITPKQSQGFAAHYDVHDVFVLQIAGTKRWIMHDPVHPDPLDDQPWTRHRTAVESRAADVAGDESILESGDALYLPRGVIHSAEALGGVSVHLTIGIHGHTRHDLLQAVLELAAEDPRLRRTLPMGVDVGDEDQLGPDLAATIAALQERICSISSADVARIMARRARDSTRPAPFGPIAQAHALDVLDQDTLIRVRPQQRVKLNVSRGEVNVSHFGGSLSFEPHNSAGLHALFRSHDGIRIGDLPELSDEQRLVLVRRLMRAGLVVAGNAAQPGR
jgi:bifunctional lysine-specific demethylase and histidyl-hydroxylase NO66